MTFDFEYHFLINPGSGAGAEETPAVKKKPPPQQTQKSVKRIGYQFKLNDITKRLDPEIANSLVTLAIRRIISISSKSYL